jgi:superfamily II DNA or RNA helicase
MTIFEKKDKLQQECLALWHKNNCQGAFYLATGVGKTRLGMLAALNYKKVLIVGPTIRIKDDRWKDEFKKWGNIRHYNKYVETVTYVSLNKLIDVYDLIILDEGHWITENNFDYFRQPDVKEAVKSKKTAIMLLTATPPVDEIKQKLIKLIAPKLKYYPLEEAIIDGVAAPFNFNIVTLPLSTDKTLEIKLKNNSYVTSEEAKYQSLTRTVNSAMYSNNSKQLQFAILNRKRFLDTLPSKKSIIEKLQLKLKDKRVLFFVGSIAECDALKNIGKHHSKIKKSNDLQMFIKGKINHLASINSLDEGEDLPTVEAVVITKLISNPRKLIQQIGRGVRFSEGHQLDVYILCTINTQEEKWLEKAMQELNTNANYVYYKNI